MKIGIGVPARCGASGGARQQIIYKHAISTIAPMRNVDLAEAAVAEA